MHYLLFNVLSFCRRNSNKYAFWIVLFLSQWNIINYFDNFLLLDFYKNFKIFKKKKSFDEDYVEKRINMTGIILEEKIIRLN